MTSIPYSAGVNQNVLLCGSSCTVMAAYYLDGMSRVDHGGRPHPQWHCAILVASHQSLKYAPPKCLDFLVVIRDGSSSIKVGTG